MKVILLTSESFPNGMAATSRIKCYAKAISDADIECKVVIFRRTEKYGLTPMNLCRKGVNDGVEYEYVSRTPLRSSTKVVRILLDLIDIILTDILLLRELHRGDVLFVYCGGFIRMIIHFLKIARLKGILCVRDLCEHPCIYDDADNSKSTLVFREQFPLLDGIISISDPLTCIAKQYARENCKHLKIPILVDYPKYDLPDTSSESAIKYIFHSGIISEQKDGILGMLKAFGDARQKLNFPIKFISTGDNESSSLKNEIKNIISFYGMSDSVSFIGSLLREEIRSYLSGASLVISNKKPNDQNHYGFSTKLGEYSAAGKPIIMTRVGEPMNYFVDGESAIFVNPGDIEELSDAIVQVFSDPNMGRNLGNNAKAVCQDNFDYHNWSDALGTFLRKTLQD